MKHDWNAGRKKVVGDEALRSGFACASSEDQLRIAEFYGYRDEALEM